MQVQPTKCGKHFQLCDCLHFHDKIASSAVKDKAQDSGDASQPCDAFSRPAVPSLFITRDWFWERQFLYRWGGGGGFGMITLTIIIITFICVLYFSYYISSTSDNQALDPGRWGPLVYITHLCIEWGQKVGFLNSIRFVFSLNFGIKECCDFCGHVTKERISKFEKDRKENNCLTCFLHLCTAFQNSFFWKNHHPLLKVLILTFPGGSDGKESACNAGDPGLIPGLGRYPGEGHGNPL